MKHALPIRSMAPWADSVMLALSNKERVRPAYADIARQNVRDALADSDGHLLAETVRDLERICRKMLAMARPEVVKMIQQSNVATESSALEEAYRLGQFSMAQHIVSHEAGNRVDIRFVPTMHSPRYRPFVLEMQREPMTGDELTAATGVSGLRLKRIMYNLQKLGIIDSRARGKIWEFFLTPAAATYARNPRFVIE